MTIPKNAEKLMETAEVNGWSVNATESGGMTTWHRENRYAASYGVRLARGSVRAYGVWVDGRYDNGQVTVRLADGSLVFPPRMLGLRELRKVIASG